MHARLAVARKELPRAVRIAVAATLAWWIAGLLGADRPVFAAIVPMVAIRDDAHAAFSLSLGRMLGVMAGRGARHRRRRAWPASRPRRSSCCSSSALAIGLFLRTGPELNTQIAISALLVLVVTEDADTYAVERIWETAVGSVVTLARGRLRPAARPAGRERAPAGARRRGRSRPTSPTRRGRSRAAIPRARVLLAHADEHARATGRAVEDLPRGAARAAHGARCGAARAPQLEVVDRRQRLALRLAIQVRRLARDLASFAHRDDLRDEWDEAAGACRRSIAAIGAGSAKALAGEGCSHEVAESRASCSRCTAARTAGPSRRSCAGRSSCSSTSSRGRPA